MGRRSNGSPGIAATRASRAAANRGQSRFVMWAALASLLVVGGMSAAVFAARSVARSDTRASRQAFEQSSAAVASTLQLAIERERDLVISAAGFFLGDPRASEAAFRTWINSVAAFERFPELFGWGEDVIVPASKLAAFATEAAADGAIRAGTERSFHVLPPGARSYYCLARASQSRSPQVAPACGRRLNTGPPAPVEK